jgi:3-polyprenyl-4-hydroxybenzoate decarboxylase
MVDHSVGRLLDLFGIENELAGRWDRIRAEKLSPPGA